MANYRTSRALPIILVVVIIIIAIAALVSLARVVFFSGSSTSPATVDTSRTALLNPSLTHGVRMMVRGPIVADEKFHSYQIDISAMNRSIKTYNGYLDSIVDQNDLGNSVASYEQFVYALDKASLAKGNELVDDKNDTRGVCANGTVTEFTILDNGESVKKLWTSTCQGYKGSLNASVRDLTSLFVKQIPNANNLISKIDL